MNVRNSDWFWTTVILLSDQIYWVYYTFKLFFFIRKSAMPLMFLKVRSLLLTTLNTVVNVFLMMLVIWYEGHESNEVKRNLLTAVIGCSLVLKQILSNSDIFTQSYTGLKPGNIPWTYFNLNSVCTTVKIAPETLQGPVLQSVWPKP